MSIRFHVAGAFLALAFVSAGVVSRAAQESTADGAGRLPAPSAEEVAAAAKRIKDLYADAFKRRRPDDMLALARKLVQLAEKSGEEPALRFTALDLARELSLRAADLGYCLETVREMARVYDIDVVPMRADILETKLRATRGSLEPEIVRAALELGDLALTNYSFDHMDRLEKILEAMRRKASSDWLRDHLERRLLRLSALESRERELKLALGNPEAEISHLAFGSYLCFILEDWTRGLPHLAAGDDRMLRPLAERELERPTDVDAALSIAASWLERAAKEENGERVAIERHAATWVARAHEAATGLDAVRVEARLKELPRRWLSQVTETASDVGYGSLGKDGDLGFDDNAGNRSVVIEELPVERSLSMHPPVTGVAFVKYRLDRRYRKLRVFAALNDTARPQSQRSKAIFTVFGDGKVLWRSQGMDGRGTNVLAEVRIQGVDELELRAEHTGRRDWLHAVWVEPEVSQ